MAKHQPFEPQNRDSDQPGKLLLPSNRLYC